jgi:DNA-binding MarR family transcriptional regulator
MPTARDRDTLLGPNDDPAFFVHRSGYDLMVALRRTQHRIEVSIDHALVDLGMTYAQYRALTLLASTPFAIDISELARRLRVARQSAHASIEKLCLQDLVEVERDGYRATVHVTDHGRRRLARCRQAASGLEAQLERAFTPERRAGLVALVGEIDDALMPPPSPLWWLTD